MSKKMGRPAALLLAAAMSGCAGPAATTRDFDWTLGTWSGVRRDAASGSEAAMVMRVEPLLGADGQLRTLSIRTEDGGSYRGTAVQLFDRRRGRWSWQYANSPQRAFARYLGPAASGEPVPVSEWRSLRVGARTSRLLSERRADGRWQRTMQRSEDGGGSWRTLWVDTLQRAPD